MPSVRIEQQWAVLFASRSPVAECLSNAGAEIGILQRRYRRHDFGPIGGMILITHRQIELGEGEIPADTINDIVEVLRAADSGFRNFAAENVLNHQGSDASLPPGWIFARPEAAGLARPASLQGVVQSFGMVLHETSSFPQACFCRGRKIGKERRADIRVCQRSVRIIGTVNANDGSRGLTSPRAGP